MLIKFSWEINGNDQHSQLHVWSGIKWIKPPMFLIKGFIEADLQSSQMKIEKYLRHVLPLIHE